MQNSAAIKAGSLHIASTALSTTISWFSNIYPHEPEAAEWNVCSAANAAGGIQIGQKISPENKKDDFCMARMDKLTKDL